MLASTTAKWGTSLRPASLPQVECKAVMVFFHYCVMSNYFWLFIEGLYLFTLLVETFFPERTYFYWYTIIGWGKSSNACSFPLQG